MITVEVQGENFVLCPEKALWWPSHSLLVIADLHLGKSETFQRHGLPLPSGAQSEDLERILRLTERLEIEHVLFLGDLVHTKGGITLEVQNEFSKWIEDFGGRVSVVIGNHDRHIVRAWPEVWGKAELMDKLEIESFVFQHEPPSPEDQRSGLFFWVGHVHPMVRLRLGPDQLRLPCFALAKHQGLIPAFSSLTGGHSLTRRKRDRFFAIVEDKVIPLAQRTED